MAKQEEKEFGQQSHQISGGGVAYDKHGNPLLVGDLYKTADGNVYKVHGFTMEQKPGTNAEYARDVVKMPAGTPWTDSAIGLPAVPQSIVWGS